MKSNLPVTRFAAIWLALILACHAGKIHDAVTSRDLPALDRALKQHPGQIDTRCYPDFETPLSMAVGIGDPAIVKRLLDAGAKITTPDIGLLPFNPLQRAAIAPGDFLLQAVMPDKIEEQVKMLRNHQAQMLAALSDEEKAARLEVLALLLAKKPELNKGFPVGNPPLHLAVSMGNTDMVKLLIRSGANVNTRSELWFTPLHIAAIFQAKRDLFEALITAGADVEASDKMGNTPLILAARTGSNIGVETLLSHRASADTENDQQIPVIGHAALTGHDEIVKLIYQKGGPNLIRFAKKELLFQCAAMGGSKALTGILLAEGVDINIRDAAGFTPLLSANESGQWELSEYLILKGADRKAKINDGRCLFDIACQAGNTALAKEMLEADGWPQGSPNLLSKIILAGRVDILELLAERKVDILEIGPTFSEGGIGALELAITGRVLSLEDNLKARKMVTASEEDYARTVELLLKHGANVNQVNRSGATPVHLAARACGSRVMNAMLKAGGSFSLPHANLKDTPLQIAAAFGRPETVRALLDAGADRNIRDSRGGTLLHLAAMNGNPETLKLLIADKLPVNKINSNDRTTPLHCAVIVNSLESVRLLLGAGAAPDPIDTTGFTPLVLAVNLRKTLEAYKNNDRIRNMIDDLRDRLRIIHVLLEAGVVTDLVAADTATGRECTLLEFAASNGTPEIVELLKNPPPVKRKKHKP